MKKLTIIFLLPVFILSCDKEELLKEVKEAVAGGNTEIGYNSLNNVTTGSFSGPWGCINCGDEASLKEDYIGTWNNDDYGSSGYYKTLLDTESIVIGENNTYLGWFIGNYIPEDSLFLSTDKPASTHEDIPQELGFVFKANSPGQITHIKFYSVSAGNYTVSIWSITKTLLLSKIVVATIGWQRIQLNIPFEVAAGDSYIVSYLTNQQFGYTKPAPVKTNANISNTGNVYSYGHIAPVTPVTESYFVDVVFNKQDIIRKPLIVNPGRDSVYILTKDSIVKLNAIVTGDSAYYSWYLVDSAGTFQLTGMNTLSPQIKTKERCTAILLLTGGDKYGNFLTTPIQIDIIEDNRIFGYLYRDGTYRLFP